MIYNYHGFVKNILKRKSVFICKETRIIFISKISSRDLHPQSPSILSERALSVTVMHKKLLNNNIHQK